MTIKLVIYSSITTVLLLLFGCTYSNSQKELSSVREKTNTSKPLEVQEAIMENENTPNENLQEIIQKSIDLPKLQQYYHIDVLPERSPLIILKSELIPSTLKLNKFGEPVEIMEESSKAHLVFSTIDIQQNTGTINFSYPIEGISIQIKFIKTDNEWLINESMLKEN